MINSRADKLINLIKFHEGFSPFPYNDVGYLSIGYGHNLSTSPLSRHIAEMMLYDDLDRTRNECRGFIQCFDSLDDVRKVVILDMCYNLGIRKLLRFVRMLEALSKGDYNKCADEMLDSDWSKQVKERAVRLSVMMRTGNWCKEIS